MESMILHLSLGSVGDFPNTWIRVPASSECAPCLLSPRAIRFECMIWMIATLVFRWLVLFSHQLTPHLKQSSRSFLTEQFDPDQWLVGFFCLVSVEACNWHNFELICLAPHPPCCITWFPLLYIFVWIAKYSPSSDIYSATRFGRISEWLWRCEKNSWVSNP